MFDMAQLRAAIHQRNGAKLVALVRAEGALDDGHPLQMIGDGLVAALTDHVEGAAEVAAAVAARLRDRAWMGDDELADQLESRLGTIPAPMLRPLAVDLEELAMVLEGDPASGGGRIDLHNGDVVPDVAFEYLAEIGQEPDEDDQDPDRWLHVSCEGSRGGYRDMERFIDTLSDARLADRLSDAIRGRGAFRRFRTSSRTTPRSSPGGTASPTNANVAGPGPGSQTRATAWFRSGHGPPAEFQMISLTSPSRFIPQHGCAGGSACARRPGRRRCRLGQPETARVGLSGSSARTVVPAPRAVCTPAQAAARLATGSHDAIVG